MALVNRPSHDSGPLKSLAVSALCLYLLIHAFLILCLVHPHNTHVQGQTGSSHPVSVCAWVHKTVASHVPSSRVLLPLAAALLFVFLPSPQHAPQFSPIRLTGRSPPLLAFA